MALRAICILFEITLFFDSPCISELTWCMNGTWSLKDTAYIFSTTIMNIKTLKINKNWQLGPFEALSTLVFYSKWTDYPCCDELLLHLFTLILNKYLVRGFHISADCSITIIWILELRKMRKMNPVWWFLALSPAQAAALSPAQAAALRSPGHHCDMTTAENSIN